jgi:aspartate/methionine/tyrosine aminotransferase
MFCCGAPGSNLRIWVWKNGVEVLADFMGTVMGGGEQVTFDPANVIITAGASGAIEMLAFCLASRVMPY